MKKGIVALLWALFVVCAAAAVVLNIKMRNADVDYEEVEVIVDAAYDDVVVNRSTGNRTTFHHVEVLYEGEVRDLENAHNLYMYPVGKQVTAYLADGRLFANVEGVQTSTPLATVYFVFLFGSFGLLFAACIAMSKLPKKKKKASEAAEGPER